MQSRIIEKNSYGQYIRKPNDNIILCQKGVWGVSDEHLAKTLNMGPEQFKIELENLVYRHVTCNFATKETLMMQLSLSEEKINSMLKRAEFRHMGIKNMPHDVSIMKAQIANMQMQMHAMRDEMNNMRSKIAPSTPNFNIQGSFGNMQNAIPNINFNAPPAPQTNCFGSVPPQTPSAPPLPHSTNTVNPNTFNQLYGSPMSTNTFTQKNYHDSNGEWVG